MPGEGILSTFSRSQLLTPVVLIIKYQEHTTKQNKDQINGKKFKMSRTHHQTEQRSNKRAKFQDVKNAPPTEQRSNKRAKISRCHHQMEQKSNKRAKISKC